MIKFPVGGDEEGANDLEFKRLQVRIKEELDNRTNETETALLSKKSFKQRSQEKEIRAKISPLNSNRPFLLIDENNLTEYWDYLCYYDKIMD
jgi:hypothetical protein